MSVRSTGKSEYSYDAAAFSRSIIGDLGSEAQRRVSKVWENVDFEKKAADRLSDVPFVLSAAATGFALGANPSTREAISNCCGVCTVQ